MDLGRKLVAEALGTGLLVATVVGSGLMAAQLTDDVALMLLCNALATGTVLAVLIAILGPISGAHFNPAVSAVFALKGDLAPREAGLYALAQIGGGIAGTMLAHAMFAEAVFQFSTTARSGPNLWLAEAVATFGLVAVILAGVSLQRAAVPWLVGLYIVGAYWFTASTSFANPALTIARMMSDSFAGIQPIDVPVFVLAQLAGAMLALAVMGWLVTPARPVESD